MSHVGPIRDFLRTQRLLRAKILWCDRLGVIEQEGSAREGVSGQILDALPQAAPVRTERAASGLSQDCFGMVVLEGEKSSLPISFGDHGFAVRGDWEVGFRCEPLAELVRSASQLQRLVYRCSGDGRVEHYGWSFNGWLDVASGNGQEAPPINTFKELEAVEAYRQEAAARESGLGYVLRAGRQGIKPEKEVLRTWEKELDGGANVDAVIDPKTQDTRLHKAVKWRHWAVVRSLLIAGASVDRRNAEGLTPLHIAAKMWANQEIIALLLAAGSDPNLKTPDGTSAFLLAVPHLLPVAKMLLRAGADVNQRGPGGTTALIKACRMNEPLSVRLLAESGADIHTRDNSGRAALEYAREKEDGLAVRVLVECGAKVDIFAAAAFGLVEEARCLLRQNPALANANEPDDWTPLHYAARNGRSDTAQLLIGAGAKVNAKTRDGWTPLDFATGEKKTETADLLRKHGARSGRPR